MTWTSPYQTENFYLAMKAMGYQSHRVTNDSGVPSYFYNWLRPQLTGWEIDSGDTSELPIADYLLFDSWLQKSELEKQKKVSDHYFSPIIKLKSDYKVDYRGSCQRNVRTAEKHKLRLTIWDKAKPSTFDKPYRDMLYLFTAKPDWMAGLTAPSFVRLVRELYLHKAADIALVLSERGKVIAAAIVLISEDMANLRFTVFDQAYGDHRPMNFLIDQLAAHYQKSGYQALDLSGLSMAKEDSKMEGINQFKLGFTKTIARFKWLRY